MLERTWPRLHVFGSCDKLQPFWSEVVGIIDGVLQCKVLRDPRVLYIGLIPEGLIKKKVDIYIFEIMMVAVKATTKKLAEKRVTKSKNNRRDLQNGESDFLTATQNGCLRTELVETDTV